MQQVIADFEKRVLEVENYFLGLREIENYFFSLKKLTATGDLALPSSFDIKSFWNVMKANSLVILYNLVEFAIRQGFLEIYQQIYTDGCSYQQLRPELRKIWVEYRYRIIFKRSANWDTARNEATDMINKVMGQVVTQLADKETYAIPISGNLDAREIRRICELHGISYQVSQNARGGNKLQSVKKMRNALAHGNLSFSDCGQQFEFSGPDGLESIKEQVIIFVRDILHHMKDYADNKQYLSTPMSP